jgi:hypothetical protein
MNCVNGLPENIPRIGCAVRGQEIQPNKKPAFAGFLYIETGPNCFSHTINQVISG